MILSAFWVRKGNPRHPGANWTIAVQPNMESAINRRRDGRSAAKPQAKDRIMTGQNHNGGHSSALMILSCHDSVCLLGSQRKSLPPASKLDHCGATQYGERNKPQRRDGRGEKTGENLGVLRVCG